MTVLLLIDNQPLIGEAVRRTLAPYPDITYHYCSHPASAFDTAWQLWPLLLIGAGLGLVLARTRAAVLGGLIVAATAGLMVGGLVVNGVGGFGGFGGGFASCGGGENGTPFADQRGTLGTDARISLQLDCGHVEVGSVDGASWSLGGESPDGRPPVVTAGDDRLAVESRPRDGRIQLGGGISSDSGDGTAR